LACPGSFPSLPGAARYARCAARSVAPFCSFLGHSYGNFVRVGEAGKGVWGKTWNRAVWGARGVPGFPPVRFRIGPLCCLRQRSRSRAVPDLARLLYEGVRSGRWRRRAASAPAQAGGGTETETQRTAPAHAGAVLYGQCAGYADGLCGTPLSIVDSVPVATYDGSFLLCLLCSALSLRRQSSALIIGCSWKPKRKSSAVDESNEEVWRPSPLM
jgi:hypothetical protein